MRDVAICIPARLNSKRFPRKALCPILGIPMVVRVAQIAHEVMPTKAVFVVTPDQEIADVVADYGIKAIVNTDQACSGTQKIMQCMEEIPFERIVNLQGDEAAARPEDLETIVEATSKSKHVIQSYSWISRDESTPENVKLVTNLSGEVIYMSRQPIPTFADRLKKSNGLYGMPRAFLGFYIVKDRMPLENDEDVEQQRLIDFDVPMRAVEIKGSMTVDLPEHVEIVENMLRCR